MNKNKKNQEKKFVSFRTKMIAMLSVIMLVIFVLIFSILLIVFTNQAEQQIRFSMLQSFDQAKSIIEQKINAMNYAASSLTSNQTVYAVAEKYAKMSNAISYDAGTEYREMWGVRDQIESLVGMEIKDIKLYLNKSFRYTHTDGLVNSRFAELDEFFQTPQYAQMIRQSNGKLWTVESINGESSLCLYTGIRSQLPKEAIVGGCRIAMPADVVVNILERANVDEKMFSLVYDTEGELCLSSSDYPDNWFEIICNAEKDRFATRRDVFRFFDYSDYYVLQDQLMGTNWNIALVIPETVFAEGALELLSFTLFSLLAVFIVGLIAYVLLARSLTKRIFNVVDKMDAARNGDLSVRVEVQKNDEIGRLGNAFNYLIERINVLNREQFNSGLAIKEAELRALRAQINPHLLYNTLDVIHWEALDYKADNIVKMTSQLAKFYKLTLNSGRDFVELSNEIAHVTAYVEIQNIRFNDAVTLITHIPEALAAQRMPHLTLQPLVENAILHGIVTKPEKKGVVEISAVLKGKFVEISVRDDGVGMDHRIVEVLQSDQSKDKGYGFANIRERMIRLYGPEAEPRIISSETGTTIILSVPFEILT